MKKIAILGSTGSIGTQALDVVSRHPDELEVVAMTAGSNAEAFLRQIKAYRPAFAAMADESAAQAIRGDIPPGVRFSSGKNCLIEAASFHEADMVLVAVVGIAGLPAVMAAIDAGKDVALANKEALVTGGKLVMQAARQKGVKILPVDSEHSAIFQCLQGAPENALRRIFLTASGGPFRTWEKERIAHAKAGEALRHPNWLMGDKITVDSATMMNKGLEIIEACHLFHLPVEKVEVVVHPQSIIHSMVEFWDHSVLAQLGYADMRLPIQYALLYPQRKASPMKPLDFSDIKELTFEQPDTERFPCLKLAMDAGWRGGMAPVILNAANEVAVAAYLEDSIGFYDISDLCSRMLESTQIDEDPSSIEAIHHMDDVTRKRAAAHIRRMNTR
ncbi:MAG: 1-deoxy-D-xylulose-5-phosphate reductoisomerase [Christensenellales bacterium]|jgi:1-deoxy-D-xylulose-5-phosphate reductoisomerase